MAKIKGYYAPKKKFDKKKACIITLTVLLLLSGFFITSLALANAHGQTLVQEWCHWFGIVKTAADANAIVQ